MLILTRDLVNRITAVLVRVGSFESETDRSTVLFQAIGESPVRNQIEWRGATGIFVPHLVDVLNRFGGGTLPLLLTHCKRLFGASDAIQGEIDSLIVVLENPIDNRIPTEFFDMLRIAEPRGGTVPFDATFYIHRGEAAAALSLLNSAFDQQTRTCLILQGARQTGKSSLIADLVSRIHEKGAARALVLDFQSFPKSCFQSADTLWQAIVEQIVYRMEIEWDSAEWRSGAQPLINLGNFLKRHLFVKEQSPVVLCFDEIDLAFATSCQQDFFAQIRAFYNDGATHRHWKLVHWVLSTATEPNYFIEGNEQSPFNIGTTLLLNTFRDDEIAAFAARHGLTDQGLPSQIREYVAGRPFLTHLLLYHLALGEKPAEQLWTARTGGGGIFQRHLDRFLIAFQEDPLLSTVLRDILLRKTTTDTRRRRWLESAGLVQFDPNTNQLIPTCRLYRDYFQDKL